ncbi:hypothetical protein SCYAM73S_02840 [Streptomyces cyaneofuscatus]
MPPFSAEARTPTCHAPFGDSAASALVTFTVYVQSAALSPEDPDGSQAADSTCAMSSASGAGVMLAGQASTFRFRTPVSSDTSAVKVSEPSLSAVGATYAAEAFVTSGPVLPLPPVSPAKA